MKKMERCWGMTARMWCRICSSFKQIQVSEARWTVLRSTNAETLVGNAPGLGQSESNNFLLTTWCKSQSVQSSHHHQSIMVFPLCSWNFYFFGNQMHFHQAVWSLEPMWRGLFWLDAIPVSSSSCERGRAAGKLMAVWILSSTNWCLRCFSLPFPSFLSFSLFLLNDSKYRIPSVV